MPRVVPGVPVRGHRLALMALSAHVLSHKSRLEDTHARGPRILADRAERCVHLRVARRVRAASSWLIRNSPLWGSAGRFMQMVGPPHVMWAPAAYVGSVERPHTRSAAFSWRVTSPRSMTHS